MHPRTELARLTPGKGAGCVGLLDRGSHVSYFEGGVSGAALECLQQVDARQTEEGSEAPPCRAIQGVRPRDCSGLSGGVGLQEDCPRRPPNKSPERLTSGESCMPACRAPLRCRVASAPLRSGQCSSCWRTSSATAPPASQPSCAEQACRSASQEASEPVRQPL